MGSSDTMPTERRARYQHRAFPGTIANGRAMLRSPVGQCMARDASPVFKMGVGGMLVRCGRGGLVRSQRADGGNMLDILPL